MKGLTPEETAALRLIFGLRPWGNDKVSRRVGRYLDGDARALVAAPELRERLDAAAAVVRAGASASDEARRKAAYDAANAKWPLPFGID
jgi:hypothetical protein